ncbi:MAG: hypothetical protein RLZZ422_1482 [Pseudomonadota bacterium]
MARFDELFPLLIQAEGTKYVDHPNDPGSATKYGITRKTLADWRGIKPYFQLDKKEVRYLTLDEAKAIYKAHYWDVIKGDSLPIGVDYVVLDYAVNSGCSRAIKQLQTLLQVSIDGVVGDETLSALKKRLVTAPALENFITQYTEARLSFLQSLKHWVVFGRGWGHRVQRVSAISIKMAQSAYKPAQQQSTLGDLSMFQFLRGRKTFATGLVMVGVGVANLAGYQVPGFDPAQAGQLITEGLGIIFIRAGIRNDVGA